ncbi:MAG: DnaD domain protein [Dehalococcoidia bacterium]|nr:DnaD domain protein [Chloroflexota bacterium]
MRPTTFPRATTFTPIPDPLLGPILESIDDLAELKCILRALWHMHRKKGSLRYVTPAELAADSVLQGTLDEDIILQTMIRATQRGVFARGVVGRVDTAATLFVLNTEADRRALESAIDRGLNLPEATVEAPPTPEATVQKPNVFTLYEENVGMITPLIAEELKDAEMEYPREWIEEAIKTAVNLNKRNWRYIAAILKRWDTEGKTDGEPGRHTKATDPERYLKEYVQRRGDLPGA